MNKCDYLFCIYNCMNYITFLNTHGTLVIQAGQKLAAKFYHPLHIKCRRVGHISVYSS